MLNDLDKAKFELLTTDNQAFIACVLLQLNIVEDNSIPTACVGKTTIRINSDMWNNLSLQHKVFVLAHETWHAVLKHTTMDTLGYIVPILYKAMDYTINNMLHADGMSMMDWVLLNRDWDGLSTKEIYDLLIEDENNGKDTGEAQDFIEFTDDPAEAIEVAEKMDSIIVSAHIQTREKSCGKSGSLAERLANNIVKPTVKWDKLLAKYLTFLSKNDYSYKKTNRRYYPLHLPTLTDESALDTVVIALDASGSVLDEDYGVAVSEATALFKKYSPKKCTLLTFTTEIEKETNITKSQDIIKNISQGYGGTDIEPVIEYTLKNKTDLLIVMSDMEFTFPDIKPRCPVIWLGISSYGMPDTCDIPYGKYYKYEPK